MAFLYLMSSRTPRTALCPLLTLLTKASSLHFRPATPIQNLTKISNWVVVDVRFSLGLFHVVSLYLRQICITNFVGVQFAEGGVWVNKPELLPKEFTAKMWLGSCLMDRIVQEITNIKKHTGFKLKVLPQRLAIRDFWQVDDRTIVFIAGPTFVHIISFNIGASVDLDIPHSFWSRLAGKYGNIFYWKEKLITKSGGRCVMAISCHLREPAGPNNFSEVK
ncbi:hypothetical protein P3X46_009668 [Hevea brasiliensis]|uniref:Uncharacterized protein n=1 Tax=Hevea brasiliensis TaxID=3981 RepID=A0ABQ9MMJ8_HEVBR|nr:hypothetical protein P3X46_009668 [Hevea brasiliensis]